MRLLITLILISAFDCVTDAAGEMLLYRFADWPINDGKFGSIATFQAGLNAVLVSCESRQRLTPDGVFGPRTKAAILEVSTCSIASRQLDADSPARAGAITTDLWHIVLPDSVVPGPADRAGSLTLTFEATDYDQMEWNFCQSKPFYEPRDHQTRCYSNDRRSYITWGPNGATAGHGREVQAIINAFLDPGMLEQAFGPEAAAVRRMLKLSDADDDGDLEVYLCSIWLDRERRAAWRRGFKALGELPDVRGIYREMYRSRTLDGGKIAEFYSVWRSAEFSLPVTEIDHAYFIDRAAQTEVSPTRLIAAMRDLKNTAGKDWPKSPAEIRRHISLSVRPANQAADRLGRDVAFYVGALGEVQLTAIEADAWRQRGRKSVLDVGLSDDRLMNAYEPGPEIDHRMPDGRLAPPEGVRCPTEVLNPKLPR